MSCSFSLPPSTLILPHPDLVSPRPCFTLVLQALARQNLSVITVPSSLLPPLLQDFRELVTSRLAACHPTHYGEVMLGAIIEEWGAGAAGSGRGCHLALRWLDALFVECVAAVKGNKGLGLEGPTVSVGGSGLGLGGEEDEEAGCGPGADGKGQAGIALWGGAQEGEDGDGEDGGAKADSKEGLVLLTEGGQAQVGVKGDGKGGEEEGGQGARGSDPGRAASGAGEDGGGVDAGLGGTVYEDVLLALLERLREAGLLSEMRELLLQVRKAQRVCVEACRGIGAGGIGQWAIWGRGAGAYLGNLGGGTAARVLQ